MNLTSKGLSFVNSIKSMISSSLKLRIATTFNLTLYIPSSKALSTARSTCFDVSGRLVMNSFLAGTRLSRLMFKCVRPAFWSLSSFLVISVPLVVIPIYEKCWPRSPTISIMSRRTSGSPPVNRTLLTPSAAKMPANLAI